MGFDDEGEPELLEAIKRKDGRAALEAWSGRICEGGGDAVHDLYLWVTTQKVMK